MANAYHKCGWSQTIDLCNIIVFVMMESQLSSTITTVKLHRSFSVSIWGILENTMCLDSRIVSWIKARNWKSECSVPIQIGLVILIYVPIIFLFLWRITSGKSINLYNLQLKFSNIPSTQIKLLVTAEQRTNIP